MKYRTFKIDPFKYEKNASHLNMMLWCHELESRWQLLNFKFETYGHEHIWRLIKEYGFHTKILEVNGQPKKTEKHSPKIGRGNFFSNYCGLLEAKSSVRSITTFELKNLCQHSTVRPLIQRIDGIHGQSYESHLKNMPDMNEPVNLALHRNHKPSYYHLNAIKDYDFIASRQYVGINIDKPEDDLVNDFRSWLKSAKNAFDDKALHEETEKLQERTYQDRTNKVKNAVNAKGYDGFMKLFKQTLKYKVFPYLDIEIDMALGGKHRNLSEKADEVFISDYLARMYTRPLCKTLMNETLLSRLSTISSDYQQPIPNVNDLFIDFDE